MLGTTLNAAGVILGSFLGIALKCDLHPKRQFAIKGLLGVATVLVGLRVVWISVGGGFGLVLQQLVLLIASMILGKLTGKVLGLQKASNRLGQAAAKRLSHPRVPGEPGSRWGDAVVACSILFCAGPMSVLGALQEGLRNHWALLAVKTVMDALTAMTLVRTMGLGVLLAAVPLVAFQGTVTLLARSGAPWLDERALLDPILAASGFLAFSISLVILDIRKVEFADYLPGLVWAPVLAWIFH